MAILLSLLTAAVFGVGDFCGGMAAKRARVLHVVAGSHLVGALGAVIASLILAERFDSRDALLGVAGGLFGVVGVALLYRRLAQGPMSVVAPLTALTSAAVPAGWGIISGERLSGLGWLGIALALTAVVLVSMTSDGAPSTETAIKVSTETPIKVSTDTPTDTSTDVRVGRPLTASVTGAVITESLLAGAGFGAMFIFFDATGEASAPWPVAAARVCTASILLLVILVHSSRAEESLLPQDRQAWLLIAAVGLFDTFSNVTFIYASNLGQLSVVGVLSALYPISTVILARVVLGERMTATQKVGFLAAMAGTELLVLG